MKISDDQSTIVEDGKTFKFVIGGSCVNCARSIFRDNCNDVPCSTMSRDDRTSGNFILDETEDTTPTTESKIIQKYEIGLETLNKNLEKTSHLLDSDILAMMEDLKVLLEEVIIDFKQLSNIR